MKAIAEALKKNSVLRHLNLFSEKLHIMKLKHTKLYFTRNRKHNWERRGETVE